jgi:uncharacterized protein YdhG (YjbR/CyaY superfamily)
MDKTKLAQNVDDYIKQFPAAVKNSLQQLRKTIKAAAPKAEEVISYGMPAYKYNGVLVYFAGYKNHIGFYGTPSGHAEFAKELSKYKSGKGSVQFPLDEPLPLKTVEQIVKFRVKQNDERIAAKKAKPSAKKPTAKLTDEEQVSAWLDKLEPGIKKEIDTVRKIIKTTSKKLKERIKWNAPSYYCNEDIITFGPYKTHGLLLIFHHPAVVKVESKLLEGSYKDRRLVHFKNGADAEKNTKELAKIINTIIKTIETK